MAQVDLRAVSIGAQTAMALGRALLVALLAIVPSGRLSRWLTARRGRAQLVAWILLLAPFFTPALLVSYGLAGFSTALIVSPWGHEALYIGVLALKLIPVAVLLRTLLPPPLSAESRHAFRMLAPAAWRRRMQFHLRAAGHGPWIAGGLVFLLAFADFELASLWAVKTWTAAIFDAQIGATLRLALAILLVPLALLLAALWLRPDPALHIARQMGSRRLLWDLETRPRAIAAGLLFCWAYFDFTAASILAPTGFTPVFVRWHHLAHDGQTSVLSAMMLAALATPILVLLLTGAARRLYARGHGR